MNRLILLDFSSQPNRQPHLGWIILGAAIALTGWQALQYSGLLQTNAEIQADLNNSALRQGIDKQNLKKQPAQSAVERSAITQAKSVATQLNYPWESLLILVESVAHPDVALLALDPKGSNSQIRVTAEAKDAAAMVAYVSSLQKHPLLQRALLTSHIVQLQQPGEPVRFQILAQLNSVQAPLPLDRSANAMQIAVTTDRGTP